MSVHRYYETWEPRAKAVKVVAQMIIGAIIFALLIFKLVLHVSAASASHWFIQLFTTHHPLQIVGYGLAFSAGVELAYMLFTEGPDEAVDPLILGIASAILLVISGKKIVGWEVALTILVFAAVIALLFFVRGKFTLQKEDHPSDSSENA